MRLLWIFAGILTGIKSQSCPNSEEYNRCGFMLQSNISSVQGDYALTFEALNFICGNGNYAVKCFLKGLQDCPNSDLTFQSVFTVQWNVALIEQLLFSGCQTPKSQAFMSNYMCMRSKIYSPAYTSCLNQALIANLLGANNLITCGLQKQGKNCINTNIGSTCTESALEFFLEWYYIQGNFETSCNTQGQGCPNSTTYNECGASLQSSISSAESAIALTFEALNYICGSGTYTTQCFLKGLRDCPNSNLAFQSTMTTQQWNTFQVDQLLSSGCQSPEWQEFMSNYTCMRTKIYSDAYARCLTQAIVANPLGANTLMTCGLQKQGKICISTHVGCNNQRALDFFLKWYYIKGNFEPNCDAVNGVESINFARIFLLIGTFSIFLVFRM